MITTKMVSPTHNSVVVLKERILCPFTCFSLSTMINQNTQGRSQNKGEVYAQAISARGLGRALSSRVIQQKGRGF